MNAHIELKTLIKLAGVLSASYLTLAVAAEPLQGNALSGLSLAPDQRDAGLAARVQQGAPRESAWQNKAGRRSLSVGAGMAQQVEELATKLRQRRARQQSGQSGQNARSALANPISSEQRAHVQAMNAARQADGGIETHFDQRNGTVTFLALPKKTSTAKRARPAAGQNARTLAKRFLAENRALLKLDDPNAETQLTSEATEANGLTHLRFQQRFRGVPLFGRELLVHLDGDGDVYLVQGRYEPTPSSIDIVTSISPDMSIRAVNQELDIGVYTPERSIPDLVIHTAADGAMALAYRVVTAPKLGERWIHFVDAHRGTIIDRIFDVQETVVAASGTDLNGQPRNFTAWSAAGSNYLIDPNTPTNAADGAGYDPVAAINAGNPKNDTFILTARNSDGSNLDFITSASTTSWDAAAVSAAGNTRTVFDYYKNTHGRNSIDGKNGSLLAVVHFANSLDNAFWSSPYMVYGDGGTTFNPLAGCLDVAAHEMTHGVVENTAGLIYQNQSGALNESFADIFGAMVDRANWTLGEGCTKKAPGYLRNMANPALGLSKQPTKMSEYRQLPQTKQGDNGGVHVNSGIPNRAAYLIAEGLTAEGLGISIGRDHTEKIFYRALTTYLTQSSQFVDARRATIKAAQDLFPADVAAVTKGWDVVEVTDNANNPAPVPQPTDPVAGEDLMVYLTNKGTIPSVPASQSYDIHVQKLAKPFTAYDGANDRGMFNSSSLNVAHTRTAVFSFKDASNNTLTDILYVDSQGDIRATEFDPANLTVLSRAVLTSSGSFSSIANSPDGRYLAFTTNDATDNQIHILDLSDDSGAGDINITVVPENHQTDTDVQNTVLFADALHFDYSSRFIIFDALNCASVPSSPCTTTGGGFNYWSIGRIEIPTRQLLYIIPNQDPLVDTGNPVFATNNRNLIALDVADRRDPANLKYKVVTWDLEQQTENVVVDLGNSGFESGSRPSFWGDDDFITFLLPDSAKGRKAFRVAIDSKGAASGAPPQELNPDAATVPIMHRAGARTLTGTLSLSAAQLDFGAVEQTGSKTLQLTLSNPGNSDVSITEINIDNPQAFQTKLSNSLIARGTSATFDVTFVPTGLTGTQTGTLVIKTDAQLSSLQVPLNGIATSGGGGGGGGCAIAAGSAGSDYGLVLLLLLYLLRRRKLSNATPG
jgi:bacillolysin